MISPRKLDKIDRNRHLLPEPGCEVVGELCVSMRKLMEQFDTCREALADLRIELDEHAKIDAPEQAIESSEPETMGEPKTKKAAPNPDDG